MLNPIIKKIIYPFIRGSCLDVLKSFSENSMDVTFADPPHNLSNGDFSVYFGRQVDSLSVLTPHFGLIVGLKSCGILKPQTCFKSQIGEKKPCFLKTLLVTCLEIKSFTKSKGF